MFSLKPASQGNGVEADHLPTFSAEAVEPALEGGDLFRLLLTTPALDDL
jgi:hypothetical protein